MNAPVLVEGASQVVNHYGYWPSFHDAAVTSVEIDCREDLFVLTIAFILNDEVEREGASGLSRAVLRWYEVEEFTISAFTSNMVDHCLSTMNLSERDGKINTDLVASDNIGGTILAKRVEVIQFTPFDGQPVHTEGMS